VIKIPPADDAPDNPITALPNPPAEGVINGDGQYDPAWEDKMSQAGELYEDVNDIFHMAQRSSTLIIKHSLKVSHADAVRIMEKWWMGCRRKS